MENIMTDITELFQTQEINKARRDSSKLCSQSIISENTKDVDSFTELDLVNNSHHRLSKSLMQGDRRKDQGEIERKEPSSATYLTQEGHGKTAKKIIKRSCFFFEAKKSLSSAENRNIERNKKDKIEGKREYLTENLMTKQLSKIDSVSENELSDSMLGSKDPNTQRIDVKPPKIPPRNQHLLPSSGSNMKIARETSKPSLFTSSNSSFDISSNEYDSLDTEQNLIPDKTNSIDNLKYTTEKIDNTEENLVFMMGKNYSNNNNILEDGNKKYRISTKGDNIYKKGMINMEEINMIHNKIKKGQNAQLRKLEELKEKISRSQCQFNIINNINNIHHSATTPTNTTLSFN